MKKGREERRKVEKKRRDGACAGASSRDIYVYREREREKEGRMAVRGRDREKERYSSAEGENEAWSRTRPLGLLAERIALLCVDDVPSVRAVCVYV